MVKEYELLQDDSHLVKLSGVRVLTGETIFVKNADDAFKILQLVFKDFAQEHVYAITMTMACEVVGVVCVGIGSFNYAQFSKVSVIQSAMLMNTPLVLMAHNHPSAYSFPSDDDVKSTEELSECCKVVGIKLLDHFVVGKDEYYSISEKRFIGGKI